MESRVLLAQFVVDSLTDTTDPDDSVTTLREALSAAFNGDEVVFEDGLAGTIELSEGPLPGRTGVTLRGNGRANTTIDADSESPLFGVVELTIEGVTLTGGVSDSDNGLCSVATAGDGKVTVRDSFVTGNDGTLLCASDGRIELEESEVTGNTGAEVIRSLGSDYSGSASIVDSLVHYNENAIGRSDGFIITGSTLSNNGGGVRTGSLTISDSMLESNAGTAAYVRAASESEPFLQLQRSTISGSELGIDYADYGYGLLLIEDSTISDNVSTEGDGAAIRVSTYEDYDDTRPIRIRNTTITGNRAEGDDARGGGLSSSRLPA